MSEVSKAKGWIGGFYYDLFFFFGSSLLAVLIGLFVMVNPIWVIPLWWAWIFLFDGPHLFVTYTRAFSDPNDRKKLGRVISKSFLFFIPGILCFFLEVYAGIPRLLDLFLLFAVLWSWHHQVRQHYGILSIYQWHAKTPDGYRSFDRWFLYISLWAMFGLFSLYHPANRKILELPVKETSAIWWAVWSGAAFVGLLALIYVIVFVWRVFKKIGVKPAVFTLLPVFGLVSFSLFLLGNREPLMANPISDEHYFLAVTFVIGFVHSLQYLGIVFAANKRRYAKERAFENEESTRGRIEVASIWKWLGRRLGVTYLLLVVLSLLYVGLVAARGNSPSFNWFLESSTIARFFLVVYWGFFFQHYYLDQKIWRVSRDPELRAELGLVENS